MVLPQRITQDDELLRLLEVYGLQKQIIIVTQFNHPRELTPEAPLVLDDALVRFDDARMAEAVELLREMAGEKQILLFTCQGRETQV